MAHIIPATERHAEFEEEPCNHRWERLNDHQLFCVFCREVQTIPDAAQATAHHHCWCGQHHLYHPWTPYIGDPNVPAGVTTVTAPQFTLTDKDRKRADG